jgi:methyl-accepting chemotaxis protein PixJ
MSTESTESQPQPNADQQPNQEMEAASGELESATLMQYRGTSTLRQNLKSSGELWQTGKGLRWSTLNLRAKATALAIAMGTIPVLVIGSTAYLVANKSITQESNTVQKNLSVALADKVSGFMFERYGDIQVISQQPIFTSAKVRNAVSLGDKQAQLDKYAEAYGFYDNIVYADLQGNPQVTTSKFPVRDNIANTEYFTMAKSGKVFISQPQFSNDGKTASVYLAAPVKDLGTGEIIGVARTQLSTVTLDAVVKEFADSDREYHLVDASDKFFVAQEKNQVGNIAAKDFPELKQAKKDGKATTFISIDKIDNANQLVGYSPLPKVGDFDLKWEVLEAIDTSEAFAAQANLLRTLALGTLAAAIAVGAVAVYIAKRATEPIQDAARTVELLGQGQFDARMDVMGEDELAVLASNINKMANEIETLVQAQAAEKERIELARQEARQEADARAQEQQQQKEMLQKRALELLLEVDPVSKGDLTIRASVTPDEIGTVADSYNAIIRSLRQIVGQVQTASDSVTQTAEGNEASIKKVAVESIQQAEAIGQALAQIQAMTETSEGMAERAKQARQQMNRSNKVVKAGDDAMNRTVEGISTIRETVSETAKKVKRLGEASQKISKVVSLIGDFAAQTNLLALNAAIEAARAGEEGRGFSVVAEEVRTLAQQSAAATAEIEQLVEEIQTQTNEVVMAMEAGTEQVVTGTQLVEESRQKLMQISAVSAQVNQLIQEISTAASEQTQTSSRVSQTMVEVAGIATATSKQSEDVAHSFGNLLSVAQGLKVSVAQFKLS